MRQVGARVSERRSVKMSLLSVYHNLFCKSNRRFISRVVTSSHSLFLSTYGALQHSKWKRWRNGFTRKNRICVHGTWASRSVSDRAYQGLSFGIREESAHMVAFKRKFCIQGARAEIRADTPARGPLFLPLLYHTGLGFVNSKKANFHSPFIFLKQPLQEVTPAGQSPPH